MMLSDLSSTSSDEHDVEPPRRPARRIRFIRDRENPFELHDDVEFKKRFRLNKTTLMNLVHLIGDAIEPRTRRNKSLDARAQILITLRFYATGGFLELIGDYMHIHKSNICRTIRRVTNQIAQLSRQYIKMPNNNHELMATKQGFFQIAGFPRVVGAVDCTHVSIQSPGGPTAELYRNRKGYFSINVQAICDSELKLLHIISRWPGSVHDSTIFNDSPLPVEFRMGRYGNGFLRGDSGYPCKPHLLTPVTVNQMNASQEAYNRAHIATRNTVERFFGVLKRRFPCLKNGLRLKLVTTVKVIVACGVLHNICKEQNDEIADYFEPIDDEENEEFVFHEGNNNNPNYAVRNALIATVFAR
jgi:hypothetical protein